MKTQNTVILIIDDEPIVRAQIRDSLEEEGFTVREARDGNEGLTIASLIHPAIVITDILMPNKEGIETIIELRRHHPKIRIIAISGAPRRPNVDFLWIANRFGADRTLAKPFRPAQLLSAIQELLD